MRVEGWLFLFQVAVLVGEASTQYTFTISGAGSTFAQPIYNIWTNMYALANIHRNVIVNNTYSGTGSGAGKAAVISRSVTYGGSDAALSAAEISRGGGLLRQFPTMGVSLAIVYNLPGYEASGEPLVLSREAIVGIFNRTIVSWTDPILTNLNPALLTLYNGSTSAIKVVVRNESSGSSDIFSSTLSRMSPAFNATYGVFSSSSGWKNLSVIKESGGKGVCIAVAKSSFSIGYTEVGNAMSYSLAMASIINQQGTLTRPDNGAHLASDITDFQSTYRTLPPENFFFRITDGNGTLSYPFVGFTYFVLIQGHPNDCATSYELFRYIRWFLTDPEVRRITTENYFSAIPFESLVYVFNVLNSFRCSDGTPLLNRVAKDMLNEQNNIPSLVLRVCISTLAAGVGAAFLGLFVWFSLGALQRKRPGYQSNPNQVLKVFHSISQLQKRSAASRIAKFATVLIIECTLITINIFADRYIPRNDPSKPIFKALENVHVAFVALGLSTEAMFLMTLLRKNVIKRRKSQLHVRGQKQNGPAFDVEGMKKHIRALDLELVVEYLLVLTFLIAEFLLAITAFSILMWYSYSSGLLLVCFGANLFSAGFKVREVFHLWELMKLKEMSSVVAKSLTSKPEKEQG
jgi:phosphate transport system substrate-binding protein